MKYVGDMSLMKWLIVGAVMFSASRFAFERWDRYQRGKAMAVAMNSDDGGRGLGIPITCKDKSKCITVYIAPWCGVCRNSEPTFWALQKYLEKNHPELGFGVVIGADSAENHAKKKSDLLGLAPIVDDSGEIIKFQRINSFPTWIITDEKGKEIFREAGGFAMTTDEQLSYVMKDFFKM